MPVKHKITFDYSILLEIRESRDPVPSQKKVAKAIGVNQSTYQRKEAGGYEISIQNIIDLAKYYKMDFLDFFVIEDEFGGTILRGEGGDNNTMSDWERIAIEWKTRYEMLSKFYKDETGKEAPFPVRVGSGVK